MNFTLNEQEVLTVGRGLSMLPYAEVTGLIDNLKTQIIAQQEPKEDQKETNEDKS